MDAPPYQWNADDYAKSSSVQQQWARELIGKLRLAGSENILDIGSGDGKVSAEIAAGVPEGSVTGIDSSDAMVALARNIYPSDAYPNLRFQLGDARRLNFENEFDMVFSNAVLHWILDQRPVLQGIRNSVKHGGRILLQMGGRGNAADVLEGFDTVMKVPEWNGYFHRFTFPYGFYDAEEYRRWLDEAGFGEIRAELIPKEAVHNDRAAFESWIRTTWLPFTQRVPEEKRELFISTIADQYIRRHPMDDHGKIHVRMMRLEAEAVKR